MTHDFALVIFLTLCHSSGKSTFVSRFLTGENVVPKRNYVSGLPYSINHLLFSTSHGQVFLNVWDTAGQEKFGGLSDKYFAGAQAAIIMFDVTSRVTYKDVPQWYADITRVCGNDIPIVLVGNKVESHGEVQRKIKPRHIRFHQQHAKGIDYFDVSNKANYQLDKPILCLLRKLMRDPNLTFLSTPSLLPAEVVIDAAYQAQMERELADAMQNPIKEDDNSDANSL